MQCYLLRRNLPSFFKVRVGEHSGISPLMNKRSNKKQSTAVKDQMLMSDQLFSFGDFKVLASNTYDGVHLIIKKSLLIWRDEPI